MDGMTSSWPPRSPDFDATAMQAQPSGGAWPMASPQWYDAAGQSAQARPDYGVRRDLRLAIFIVAALAVAGVLSGFVWHAVSARPQFAVGAGGSISWPADKDKNYFGAEAAFFAVTAAAGLVSGLSAWTAGRRRGPAVAVALALGSVAAGAITRAVGESQPTNAMLARACGQHDNGLEGICSVYNGHLELRALGLTLTWALISLAVFLTLSMIVDRPPRQLPHWVSPGQTPPPWQPPPPPGFAMPPAPQPPMWASPQQEWPPRAWPPPPS
jgi:hypothetical protein